MAPVAFTLHAPNGIHGDGVKVLVGEMDITPHVHAVTVHAGVSGPPVATVTMLAHPGLDVSLPGSDVTLRVEVPEGFVLIVSKDKDGATRYRGAREKSRESVRCDTGSDVPGGGAT
jgi:hypothetical protein